MVIILGEEPNKRSYKGAFNMNKITNMSESEALNDIKAIGFKIYNRGHYYTLDLYGIQLDFDSARSALNFIITEIGDED